MATAEKQSPYPKTLWAASPRVRTRILVPDPANPEHILHRLRFHGGSVTVRNELEEVAVRRAMKGRVYEQDLTKPEIDQANAWVCYSSKAFIAYLKNRPAQPDPLRR